MEQSVSDLIYAHYKKIMRTTNQEEINFLIDYVKNNIDVLKNEHLQRMLILAYRYFTNLNIPYAKTLEITGIKRHYTYYWMSKEQVDIINNNLVDILSTEIKKRKNERENQVGKK